MPFQKPNLIVCLKKSIIPLATLQIISDKPDINKMFSFFLTRLNLITTLSWLKEIKKQNFMLKSKEILKDEKQSH